MTVFILHMMFTFDGRISQKNISVVFCPFSILLKMTNYIK